MHAAEEAEEPHLNLEKPENRKVFKCLPVHWLRSEPNIVCTTVKIKAACRVMHACVAHDQALGVPLPQKILDANPI